MMTVEAPLRLLLLEDNPGDARLVVELLSESQIERFEIEHGDPRYREKNERSPDLRHKTLPGIDQHSRSRESFETLNDA